MKLGLLVAAVLVSSLMIGVWNVGPPTRAATSTAPLAPSAFQTSCDDRWRQIDTDDHRSGNMLTGVAVAGRDRVWVVGENDNGRLLIKRWNGRRWSRERAPNLKGWSEHLNDVDAGRGAVIAVGGRTRSATMRTFAVRRSTGRWRVTNSADPSSALNGFDRVAVLARDRAWGVGTYWDSSADHRGLIEKWTGRGWKTFRPMGGLLHGVYARSRDDVWAVGRVVRNGKLRTLTARFNGDRWRVVPSPNRNDKPHILYGIDGDARNNVWAVGYHYGRQGEGVPISMHWNGRRWRLRAVPEGGVLQAVSVRGNDVVAVGERIGDPLVLRRARGEWQPEEMPGREDTMDLGDVEHAPNGAAYIAGSRTTSNGSETVYMRPPRCP